MVGGYTLDSFESYDLDLSLSLSGTDRLIDQCNAVFGLFIACGSILLCLFRLR